MKTKKSHSNVCDASVLPSTHTQNRFYEISHGLLIVLYRSAIVITVPWPYASVGKANVCIIC